jgi:type IV pilus assembly protein PilO
MIKAVRRGNPQRTPMQFDNLNIEINDLTLNNIINWPLSVRMLLIGIFSLLLFGLGFWLDTWSQFSDLDNSETQEIFLRQQFEFKQQQAASFDAYQEQMQKLHKIFGDLLKQLPSSNEVPELLEDISKHGLESGLMFHLVEPQVEISKQFYAELPIHLEVYGTYHQIATFISKVASLPRIVTLNDFALIRTDSETKGYEANSTSSQQSIDTDPRLHFKVTASTYRYVESPDNDEDSKHA